MGSAAHDESKLSEFDFQVRRTSMTLKGRVVNGAVVLDNGGQLPEGARVRLKVVEELPDDHPCAPYNRERELEILRASIEEAKSGRGGMTLEQFEAEFAKEFKLPAVRPE